MSESFLGGWIVLFLGLFVLDILLLRSFANTGETKKPILLHRSGPGKRLKPKEVDIEEEQQELRPLKDLYFKLHNLQNNLECLPAARELLCQSLHQAAIKCGNDAERCHGRDIGSLPHFDSSALRDFISEQEREVGDQFRCYIHRRRQGGSRELFVDRDAAIRWLRQQAPLRCVDGAWLGRVSPVRAQWQHHEIMHMLWQTLSEELGDGHLSMNHARIYRELMLSFAPDFPLAHSQTFGDVQHGADDVHLWGHGIIQLVIALFATDFLPELVGFNLHFECPTLTMLQAAVELQEVDLDPSYFRLHITIDNSASGHTAMALEVVCRLMNFIHDAHGPDEAQKMWKRIQQGYQLSQRAVFGTEVYRSGTSQGVVVGDIFQSKMHAATAAHCTTSTKIGSKTLLQWLDPQLSLNITRPAGLLAALAKSPAWIRPGDPLGSRFFREISQGGRMFGAFTDQECNAIRGWIVALERRDCDRCKIPTLPSQIHPSDYLDRLVRNILQLPIECTSISSRFMVDAGSVSECPAFPTIFMAQLCLLDGFVAIPSKTGNQLTAAVLRILRAHNGLSKLDFSVTGLDHVATLSAPKPWTMLDVGLEILAYSGLGHVRSLEDLLRASTDSALSLVRGMLQLSDESEQYAGMLLGISMAFVSVYGYMAGSCAYLSDSSQNLLREVSLVMEQELLHCEQILEPLQQDHFHHAFAYVKSHFEQNEISQKTDSHSMGN